MIVNGQGGKELQFSHSFGLANKAVLVRAVTISPHETKRLGINCNTVVHTGSRCSVGENIQNHCGTIRNILQTEFVKMSHFQGFVKISWENVKIMKVYLKITYVPESILSGSCSMPTKYSVSSPNMFFKMSKMAWFSASLLGSNNLEAAAVSAKQAALASSNVFLTPEIL